MQLASKAITVREQIEANPEWLWAKNEANLGRLISSLEALKSALGEFDNNFIMKPVSSLRRGMTKERLAVGLEAFMLLEAPLSKLQKSVGGLLAMHAARGAWHAVVVGARCSEACSLDPGRVLWLETTYPAHAR